MKLADAICYAIDGEAVLFAGSGFCLGARNIRLEHNEMPLGDALRRMLVQECGVERSTATLEQAAGYYKTQFGSEKLIDYLRQIFTVRPESVTQSQERVACLPWKRIYTTNYDACIELARSNCGMQTNTITPGTVRHNLSGIDCVHLNGYIDYLNADDIDKLFRLTSASYDADWYEGVAAECFHRFKEDLNAARAIIVVGCSLACDTEMRKIFTIPSIIAKTVFVNGPKGYMDPIVLSGMETYGEVSDDGIDELAEDIKECLLTHEPNREASFCCFEHPYRNVVAQTHVSLEDVMGLYQAGIFDPRLLQRERNGDYKYVISRTALNAFIREYKSFKVFYVTSGLGNGKTLFCELVRDCMKNEDVDVYFFKEFAGDVGGDVDRICAGAAKRRSLVIIDNVKDKLSVLERFRNYQGDRITFLLTARAALNLTVRDIAKCLDLQPNDIRTVSLENMDNGEARMLSHILDDNKLYSPKLDQVGEDAIYTYISHNCNGRFCDLLLDFYRNSQIKYSIKKAWEKCEQQSPAVHKLAVFALMQVKMNLPVTIAEMMDMLKIDFSHVSDSGKEALGEFFSFEDDAVIIRSSVVAGEILNSTIGIDKFIETMKFVVKAADARLRFGNAKTEEMLKNIVSHSHFKDIEYAESDRWEKIESFYDEIRELNFCKNSIFFWEQYASAAIDEKSYNIPGQSCVTELLKQLINVIRNLAVIIRTGTTRRYTHSGYRRNTQKYTISVGMILLTSKGAFSERRSALWRKESKKPEKAMM